MVVLFKASVPNTWISGQVAIKLLGRHVRRVEHPQVQVEDPQAVCECGQPKASMDKKACERCAYLESYGSKYDRVIERSIMIALGDGDEMSISEILSDLAYDRNLVKSTLRRITLEGLLIARQDPATSKWFYRKAQ